MKSSEKTAGDRPSWLAGIVAGVLGIVGWIASAVVAVVLVVGSYAAVLWAATVVVVLTAAAIVVPPKMADTPAADIVSAAKANYAPLASADDGVQHAADQTVAGIVYARDGVDAGANWLLKKVGF